MRVENLSLENIRVKKLDGYSGYDIYFTSKGQEYCLMVAKGESFVPLSILHHFSEFGRCPLCSRMVIPAPSGKQPCMALKKIDKQLLNYFQKHVILK